MKKIVAIILTFILSLSLFGCNVTTTVKRNKVDVADSDLEKQIVEVSEFLDGATFCVFEYGTETSKTYEATGSGVVYKIVDNGNNTYTNYLVTNKHVVSNGEKFRIYTGDGSTLTASNLGVSSDYDIAVLTFTSSTKYNAVSFADIDDVKKGQYAIAMGTPLSTEYFNTLTVGNVSRIGDLYVQHDAAINSGNSGGPLVNLSGELLGINTQKISQSSSGVSVEGMYFAIRCDIVQKAINEIEKNNTATSAPILGITVTDVSSILEFNYASFEDCYNATIEEVKQLYINAGYNETTALSMAKSYCEEKKDNLQKNYNTYYPLLANIPTGVTAGLLVTDVTDGLAGSNMGIAKNDVIIKIGSLSIASSSEFMVEFKKYSIGSSISLTVNRSGDNKILTGTL